MVSVQMQERARAQKTIGLIIQAELSAGESACKLPDIFRTNLPVVDISIFPAHHKAALRIPTFRFVVDS